MPKEQSLEGRFVEWVQSRGMSDSNYIQVNYEATLDFIQSEISQAKQEAVREFWEKIKPNFGFMRQWLNENRITDPDKMVTTEELLKWIKSEEELKKL